VTWGYVGTLDRITGHHIRHWADDGNTDLDNGTLLCGRHHTIVHRDRLTATLTSHTGGDRPPGVHVVWNRRLGSYDDALARGPTATPVA
jgi:hypothetical protein